MGPRGLLYGSCSLCLLLSQRDQPITLDFSPLMSWSLILMSWEEITGSWGQIPICSQTHSSHSSRALHFFFKTVSLSLPPDHLPCTVTGPNQEEEPHCVSTTLCTFLSRNYCHTRFKESDCCLPSSIGRELLGGRHPVLLISVSARFLTMCKSELVLKTVE